MSKLEEIQDELKTLLNKRDKMIIEANELQKQVEEKMKMFYEISPDFIKGECPTCAGKGMIQGEEGKKVICPSCRGDLFIWLKVFKETGK